MIKICAEKLGIKNFKDVTDNTTKENAEINDKKKKNTVTTDELIKRLLIIIRTKNIDMPI